MIKLLFLTSNIRVFLLGLFSIVAVLTFNSCKKDEPVVPIVPEIPVDSGVAPVANFSYNLAEQTITTSFTGSGSQITFNWSFGDGASSSEESPVHTYIDEGTFEIELIVSNEYGSDTTTSVLDISLPARSDSEIPFLSLPEADVYLYAFNNFNIIKDEFNVEQSTVQRRAFAHFYSNGAKTDVGQVTVKSIGSSFDLVFDSANSSYSHIEDTTYIGFNQGQGTTWNHGSGNSFGTVNGIGNLFPFPKLIGDIDSGIVDISGEYTFSLDGAITDSDSVFFILYGPKAALVKRVGADINSATFSAIEMASLGNGYGIAQVAGYHFIDQALGGKNYYLINSSIKNRAVRFRP